MRPESPLPIRDDGHPHLQRQQQLRNRLLGPPLGISVRSRRKLRLRPRPRIREDGERIARQQGTEIALRLREQVPDPRLPISQYDDRTNPVDKHAELMIEVAGFEPAPPAPQVCEYNYVIGGEHCTSDESYHVHTESCHPGPRDRATQSIPVDLTPTYLLGADVWERGTRAHEVVRHETRTLRQDRREEPSPLG